MTGPKKRARGSEPPAAPPAAAEPTRDLRDDAVPPTWRDVVELEGELLACMSELRLMMQTQLELLSVVAAASLRTAQIAEKEHRLAWPTAPQATSKDALGLLAKAETLMKRIAMAEALSPTAAPAGDDHAR